MKYVVRRNCYKDSARASRHMHRNLYRHLVEDLLAEVC